jgi:large subunit ribosomal protein L24
MWVSKLGLVEPTTKKLTRIGFQIKDDGTKVRVYKSTGKEIK